MISILALLTLLYGLGYFLAGLLFYLPASELVGAVMATMAFALLIRLALRSNSEEHIVGDMLVSRNDLGVKTFTLSLDADPEKFETMPSVTFRVLPADPVSRE